MTRAVISQELRPGIFTGAEKDGVGVFGGFFRERGDVQTTQHYVSATLAVMVRDSIGPVGRRYVDLDYDHVGPVIEEQFLNVFVGNTDIIV